MKATGTPRERLLALANAPTTLDVVDFLVRAHKRIGPAAFDELMRGALRKRSEAIARRTKRALARVRAPRGRKGAA